MRADCHMHMVLDGVDWKKAIQRHREGADIPWIRAQLARYREKGFTYLRDGGDRWGVGAAAKKLAQEYGITYRTPLANLCKEGHYGSFIGRKYKNMTQFREMVMEIRETGGDFIKIMIAGLMDFDRYGVLSEAGLEKEEIEQLVRIAHDEGMAVMAHANGAETVRWAAKAGVDSVEHGAYLDEAALDAMGEMGTVWVPTLSTVGNLRGTGRFDEYQVAKILESAMENVRLFGHQGGLIAPGTDAGAWAVEHGELSEYKLLEESLGGDFQKILEKGIGKIREKF